MLTIVRFGEDTTVSVAPRFAPNQSYELGPVIAALEHRHFSERDAAVSLLEAANLLCPRLLALDAAFSPEEFLKIQPRI